MGEYYNTIILRHAEGSYTKKQFKNYAALTYLKIKANLLLFLYMNSALIFVLRLIALLSSALIRIRQ